MASWEEEFPDFVPTTKESLKANPPGQRNHSDRQSFLKPELKLFRPKVGQYSQIRIVPNKSGLFGIQVALHYDVGPEKGSCACQSMKRILNCPQCSYSRRLYNAGNKELGKKMACKTYYLSYVIDRANPDLGVQIFQYPNKTYEAFYNKMQPAQIAGQKPRPMRSLDHPIGGHDIIFKKQESKGAGSFQTLEEIELDGDSSPLGTDAQIHDYLSFVRAHYPLEDFLNFIEPDKLQELIDQTINPGAKALTEDEDGYDGQSWTSDDVVPSKGVSEAASIPSVSVPAVQSQAQTATASAETSSAPQESSTSEAPNLDLEVLKNQLKNRPRN